MAESFFAKITPLKRHGGGGPVDPGYGVEGPGEPVDPGYGGGEAPGEPEHPILPPLPGIWPPAGRPSLPIALPPLGSIELPIYLPSTPEHPITLPPGVWPPLRPEVLPPTEKSAVLVLVVGMSKGDPFGGYRWYVHDPATAPTPTPPIAPGGTPQPKFPGR